MAGALGRWGVAIAPGAPGRGAIVGGAYDRVWFGVGAAAVAVAFVAGGRLLGAGATLGLYVAFNALFNLPHQFCTWVRAFGEEGPVPRARWMLAAGIILAVALAARAVPSWQALLLTNFLPYWGLWHLAAQSYGITRLYRRKAAGGGGGGAVADGAGARWDRAFHVSLFAIGLLRLHAATDLTFRVGSSTTSMWRLPIPAGAGHALEVALALLYAAVCAARLLPALRANPARAAFEAAAAAATFAGFFGTDQVMITTAAITSLHNVHYIGLVRYYRATRARVDARVAPLGRRALVGAYAYSLGVHAVFLVSMFAGETLLAMLVALHYVVDAKIWRFRETPQLARYLGVAAAARS